MRKQNPKNNYRNATGGNLNREQPVNFTFDGRRYLGFSGDTLASALLANGVRVVGRSFKYHRPRGIFAAGVEEPNALVQLRTGARTEPNMQATRIELYEGLVAQSQNRWPCLQFDIGAINSVFKGLIPSGFYYKTFMWPAKVWRVYEHFIRHVAGMGKSAEDPDPDTYTHRFKHCDVLVAGGGAAGLSAALSAGRCGARVILADDAPQFGGTLLCSNEKIDGKSTHDWIEGVLVQLNAMENVTLLVRTMVTSYYDHNMLILNERVSDHLLKPLPHQPRQRVWQVRAKEVVLATGALERPLVFANNDRPGVMLASAAQSYANRFGVRAGNHAVVFTNNSSAYSAASDLVAAGINVISIVDARHKIPSNDRDMANTFDINILEGHSVVTVNGAKAVRNVSVMALSPITRQPVGKALKIQCDLVAISGGWSPSVHLFSQSRGKLRYDDNLAAFIPDISYQRERSVGASNGVFTLRHCIDDGIKAGMDSAIAAGLDVTLTHQPLTPLLTQEIVNYNIEALWAVPQIDGHHGKSFVDYQNDVTAEDVALAHRENFISVEHLKRYTTLGMGTDQGRTSNVNGLALMAGLRNEDIPAVGTTTFRPPCSPMTLGAVAGSNAHECLSLTRKTPMHHLHAAAGALFAPAGYWLRAQCYLKPGEPMERAIFREVHNVRNNVGIIDISTLGKIDLQGRDIVEFLNRVYINGYTNLPIGKSRYGVMLREDGFVLDDGTVTRIGKNRFLLTTTTAQAGNVMTHLEKLSQVHWPDLDVSMTSVTDDWAGIAIAGPLSRELLTRISSDVDLSNTSCPFLAYRECRIFDYPTRLFRISFSGELGYEINVPSGYGADFWQNILQVGSDLDIAPYGTEAMNILRIEKGHVTGSEITGRTTADDLGFGNMMSNTKLFVGQIMAKRSALVSSERRQLVGLIPKDKQTDIPRGGQIVSDPRAPYPIASQGEVTAQCSSPSLGHPVALALLENGRARHGETLVAHSPLTRQSVAVTITTPIFIDPAGDRLYA
ncbi:MAG: hypothetical protein CBB68_12850 [Rhodospirillaceae bacterium TMED8]|nr:sarcosine oxidase subunit alpha family protein [Magnetovibrio sp.]OUT48995.1 MAG: hypothetical protein CBB68_12850 [Rhodospirillaceae bacterium TMED8]